MLTAGAAAMAQTENRDVRKDSDPRDAAEAVQEGSVPQWVEYYRRERELALPPPAEAVPPAATQPRDERGSKSNPQQ